MKVTGNIVDVINGTCFYGTCVIEDGRVASIEVEGVERPGVPYLMPGFVDAHVHIESSMLVPSEFARLAVRHGTVATVSDPHEIANVLGVDGVEYMLANAALTPFNCHFGVPSCVPATAFETAGAVIDASAVAVLLQRGEFLYLSEMMNYPGVLFADPEVMAKITAAKAAGKPVDGHAPGLTGDDAIRYIAAGISTDHECVAFDEAHHKVQHGMKIIIREGSAAKNFEALHPLIGQYPEQVMLCSDDKHPDDLLAGHINTLAARAVSLGYRWQDVLRAACINPVLHYKLPVGLLRPGDPADMIMVRDLRAFEVIRTWINGDVVFDDGEVLFDRPVPGAPNNFQVSAISPEALRMRARSGRNVRLIRAIDGALLTAELHMPLTKSDGYYQTDTGCDALKIAVINRYRDAAPATAFIHGFGLRRGAIASSVAHDSHNIVAVGVDDESLAAAINLVIAERGGIAAVDGNGNTHVLPLPVAGIMSPLSGEEVAERYTQIDRFAKSELGCMLTAPFMTLSFMALLVIPQLKLSDLGLFDGAQFRFVDVEV